MHSSSNTPVSSVPKDQKTTERKDRLPESACALFVCELPLEVLAGMHAHARRIEEDSQQP